MNVISELSTVYPDISVPDLTTYYTDEIDKMKHIYQNEPPWLRVNRSGLYKRGKRNRALLNTAKIVCDKLATLTFSEQCDITISDKKLNEYVSQVLETNKFWEKMPEFLSRSYAMGGGVIKVRVDNNTIYLDYLIADTFVPLKWDNLRITSGVFCSSSVSGGKYYSLFERHDYDTAGNVTIHNDLFLSTDKYSIGGRVPLSTQFPNMPEVVTFEGIYSPMFCYFMPAIGNNKKFDVPLGLSVYSNATDTLKALDVLFDSFIREFTLGKKRIIVPSGAVQTIFDTETDKSIRYFDDDDEVYQALYCEDAEQLKITDNTLELRVQQHVDGINAMLNILCMQIGLSPGALSFDRVQGLKTATEVTSEEKDTLRTVNNNKNLVTELLEDLVGAIINCYAAIELKSKPDYTVNISWQDNVIIDDNTRIDNNVKLYQAGLISRKTAIMDTMGYDETEADAEIDRINKEQDVSAPGIDDLFSGSDK